MYLNRSKIVVAGLLFCALTATNVDAKKVSKDTLITSSESFINSHPDLMHRIRGLEAYKKLRYEEALIHFRRAARFADKPSQGMIAEMTWLGQGTAVDRPSAYAWMDLAAERAYSFMLVKRETYWASLSEAERSKALEIGNQLYRQYGDDVTKKRLETALRRAKNNSTGSRLGATGALTIYINTPTGQQSIDGSAYYQEKFWKPDLYWKWQDNAWKNLPTGKVDIGPLEISPETIKKK